MASGQTIQLALALVLTSGSLSVFVAGTDFDYFTFAQTWPPATCVEGESSHKTCHIGANIKTWVVHGLWPEGKHRPEDCNSTWKFDFSKVAGLKEELDTFWPNLYNNTPYSSFWEHEWVKHGTCATSLPATKDEFSFFKQGLQLNHFFNLTRILAKSNIVPSDTDQYSYEDFYNAIIKELNVKPTIECAYKKLPDGSPYHLIFQIMICVDKKFQAIDCSQAHENLMRKHSSLRGVQQDETLYFKRFGQSNCPLKESFYYPTIKHY